MIDAKKTIINLLGFVGICGIVLLAIYLGIYFWPFLIAIVFAIILEKFVNAVIKQTKAPRKIVGMIFVILLFLILLLLVYILVSSLIKEAIGISMKIPGQYEMLKTEYNGYFATIKDFMNNMPAELSNSVYDIGLGLLDGVIKAVTSVVNFVINLVLFFPNLLIYVIITFLATLFLVTDKRGILRIMQDILPYQFIKKTSTIVVGCFKTLGKYLKAQCLIISITFAELFLAFVILRQPYPLTLALIIAIVDALPILGTGGVLIPWAIYSAITGNIGLGIGLIVSYLVITIVRQLVEPKIVSSNLGVHPFITLLAMYIGFKLFGLFGLVVGPVVMVIFKNVFAVMFEAGYFKKLFVYKKSKGIKD